MAWMQSNQGLCHHHIQAETHIQHASKSHPSFQHTSRPHNTVSGETNAETKHGVSLTRKNIIHYGKLHYYNSIRAIYSMTILISSVYHWQNLKTLYLIREPNFSCITSSFFLRNNSTFVSVLLRLFWKLPVTTTQASSTQYNKLLLGEDKTTTMLWIH